MPQYSQTGGVLQYPYPPPAAAEADPGPKPQRAVLSFGPGDLAQGERSLRVGDVVSFRIATNLQVGWARQAPAATASRLLAINSLWHRTRTRPQL
jgi:hypothetical protein